LAAIHPSATRPRYPDGMSAADRVTHETRRIAVRLPRPLWIGVAVDGRADARVDSANKLTPKLCCLRRHSF